MKKAIFYHAGCPVCVSAEHGMLNFGASPQDVKQG